LDGIKAFLTKQVGPFPVFVYLVGAAALVGGLVFFRSKADTGSATAAPQTNYPTDNQGNPYPYPNPGSGAAGIPPSSAFDLPTPGSSVGQYSPQSNFVPAAAENTASQQFASSTAQVPTPSQYFGSAGQAAAYSAGTVLPHPASPFQSLVAKATNAFATLVGSTSRASSSSSSTPTRRAQRT
jgi:hypothetical protein